MPKPTRAAFSESELRAFQTRIGVQFRDSDLLREALTHASYTNEHPDDGARDNERLEFLGDTLVNYVAADLIYHRLPDLPEGRMTLLRSALVRDTSLAGFAEQLGLAAIMRFGRGLNAETVTLATMGSAFEALVAAIYIDQGMETARGFVFPLMEAHLLQLDLDAQIVAGKDSKTRLQEWTMAQKRGLPTYRMLRQLGAEHQPEFLFEVLIEDEVIARGAGSSKQAAQQAAAATALEKLTPKLTQADADV